MAIRVQGFGHWWDASSKTLCNAEDCRSFRGTVDANLVNPNPDEGSHAAAAGSILDSPT